MGKIMPRSYFIIISWLLTVIACQPTRETRNSFQYSHYCYDGKPTGLDSILNTFGYYAFWKPFLNNVGYPSKQVQDTMYWKCLFFNDGFFIFNFDINYFQSTANNKYGFYNRGTRWGRYIIKEDTIKAQYVESPGGMSWEKVEMWFKVVDRSTIKQLYSKARDPIGKKELQNYHYGVQNQKISSGVFVKYDSLPNPDKSWLKKRKWFWCDGQKFKDWNNTQAKKNKNL